MFDKKCWLWGFKCFATRHFVQPSVFSAKWLTCLFLLVK